MQRTLFELGECRVAPFKTQLLKWVGSKQRYAHEIVSYFPKDFGRYFEPFLGSAGVLATLAPEKAIASDVFGPLIHIWQSLHDSPHVIRLTKTPRRSSMARRNSISKSSLRSLAIAGVA